MQKLSQKIPKSKNFHCALICENSKISKIFFQKKISQIFQKPPLNSPPLKRETPLANPKRILTNPPCLKQSF